MGLRDVLALVLSADADAGAIAAARKLSELNGCARVFLMQVDPEPSLVVTNYAMSEVWAELSARVREGVASEEDKLRCRLRRLSPAIALHAALTPPRLVRARAAAEGRLADIVVMVRPSPDSGRPGQARRDMLEGVLLGAGRPVLLTPQEWLDKPIGRHVVVGWNDAREAARAIADAGPILDTAERITIVTADHRARARHGPDPGDVVAHLDRCGLKAEARRISCDDGAEGAALLRECNALKADLLVMGGYGHTNLRETVFGGATRAITVSATLPVLLSH